MNKKDLKSLARKIVCVFVVLSIPCTLEACSDSSPKTNSQPSISTQNQQTEDSKKVTDAQKKAEGTKNTIDNDSAEEIKKIYNYSPNDIGGQIDSNQQMHQALIDAMTR
jgi:hypothetical protein